MAEAVVEETPEEYRVIALKYRPSNFDEVAGQQTVVRTLQGEIAENRVGHAYLFTGPRGVGKTSMARIFAKALNCVDGPTAKPCGKCVHCVGIATDSDLDVVEVDAATYTKKEETIELLEGIDRAAFNARYKVYIIDEVHMFSNHSFNVLLKRLEEPPPGVIFILATTNPEKIPETVISRCRRLEFDRMETGVIVTRLLEIADREKVEFADNEREKVLEAIALASEGGMRDAQVALDQLISLSEGRISLESAQRLLGFVENDILHEMLTALIESDSLKALTLVQSLADKGRDLQRFVKTFTGYLRDGMLLRAEAPAEMLKVSRSQPERLRDAVKKLSLPALLNMIQQFLELEERMRGAAPARFLLEFTLMKLTAITPNFVLDAMDTEALRKAPPPQPGGSSTGAGNSNPPQNRIISLENEDDSVARGGSKGPMAMAVMNDSALRDPAHDFDVEAEPGASAPFPPDPQAVSQLIAAMGGEFGWAGPILKDASIHFPEPGRMNVQLQHQDGLQKERMARPDFTGAVRRQSGLIFGQPVRITVTVAARRDSAAVEEPEPEYEPRVIQITPQQDEKPAETTEAPAEVESLETPANTLIPFQEAMEKYADLRDAVALVKKHCGADPLFFNGRRI